jgi:hypothetical protein
MGNKVSKSKSGHTDTDMGMDAIFKEMDKLKSMCVKVGITEDVGAQKAEGSNATIAEIAAYNELGVMKKDGSDWYIPPRPFIRGFADGKREQIAKTQELIVKRVTDGKIDADTAIRSLGEFGASGVQSYIKSGTFAPNSPVTIHGSKPDKKGKKFIKGKRGSTKPLIDTKQNLLNRIIYQIINKPVDQAKE